MTTRILHPDVLPASELDGLLAKGWFRIGPTMITCRFLYFEEDLRSVIWTRLALEGYTMRGGLQRRLRRAQRRFTMRSGPARPDALREALYQRYLEVAPGDRAESLEVLLFGDPPLALDVFNTREISFWDGDRLVAFHWFDLGGEGVQSIIGAYDPSYARHSLGFVGLLAEILWARDQGYRYHYPGYVVPGTKSMDYKLRVGGLEGYDPDRGAWLPYEQVYASGLALQRLEESLREVAARLDPPVRARMIGYPFFSGHHASPELGEGRRPVAVPAIGNRSLRNLDQPRFLYLGHAGQQPVPLIVFDPETALWRLAPGWRLRGTGITPAGETVNVEKWMEEDPVCTSEAPEAFATEVLRRFRDVQA